MKQGARAAILEAAEQVMTAQGLRAARMEDIAARVGVSVGTLYNYFKDRQQLLDALIDQRGQELLAELDKVLERSAGQAYRVRLHGFVRCLLEHSWTHLRLFGLLLEDAMAHGVPGDQSLERQQQLPREVARRLADLNRDGVRQGLLRPEDAEHYPVLLLGMVQAVVFQQLLPRRPGRSDRSAPVEGAVDLLLRCFLDGAAAQPRQRRTTRSTA